MPTNLFITPFPEPAKAVPSGTFSVLLTDPSRTNSTRHTSRQFMVSVWYPTVREAGVIPTRDVEAQVSQKLYDFTSSGGGNYASQVAAFFSHSLSNAPLATTQAKYPVVLYSPGLGGQRRNNTATIEELVAAGYVVVGLDHRDTATPGAPLSRGLWLVQLLGRL